MKVDVHINLLNKLNEPRDHVEYGFLRQANSALKNAYLEKCQLSRTDFFDLNIK